MGSCPGRRRRLASSSHDPYPVDHLRHVRGGTALKAGQTIQWRDAPPEPEHLSFHVYVGEPPYCELTLNNHIGDVVQMPLTNGRGLWVIAQSDPVDETSEQTIRNRLDEASKVPDAYPFTVWWNTEGVPVFLDAAAIYRPPNG
jgi:hypothetical protein